MTKNKVYIDAGTSWCKVLEICDDGFGNSSINSDFIADFELKEHTTKTQRYFLFPSNLINKTTVRFDRATGHMVKNKLKEDGKYENELISLAYGAKKLIPNLNNSTIVDLGSRDAKWVKFENKKYKDLDWNGNCASVTGATVEMLCKFYEVDTSNLPVNKSKIPVTCGVFAMEKIMDEIANNTPVDDAISKYIHGIAYNTWKFAQEPDKIYLSGGFCNNKCFVETLQLYCEVEKLERFVLLEGLVY